MHRIIRSQPSPAMVVALIALLVAAGGAAVASIPGAHRVISACYQKKGGNLRVVDTSKRGFAGKCRKSEKSLSWNEQGPRGLDGVAGSQGTQGVQGLKGDPGSAVAFARVAADGTLDTAHSKNISSASLSSGTGVYCVTPSVPVTSVVVSVPHVIADSGNLAQAGITGNGDTSVGLCSTPVWVSIRNASGAPENHPFYLVFN